MLQQLFSMFTKTSIVRTAYKEHCAKPDSKPYSIQDYLFIIGKDSNKEIAVHEVNVSSEWDPKCFKGQLYKYENRADIIVPPIRSVSGIGVTECERNFAVMKEASHLLIDHDSDQVSNISQMVTSIINVGGNIVLNNQSDIIKSEYIGVLTALELLFPHDQRAACKAAIESKERTTLDIAREYMIPENQVIRALDEELYISLEHYRNEWRDKLDEIVIGFEIKKIDLS